MVVVMVIVVALLLVLVLVMVTLIKVVLVVDLYVILGLIHSTSLMSLPRLLILTHNNSFLTKSYKSSNTLVNPNF